MKTHYNIYTFFSILTSLSKIIILFISHYKAFFSAYGGHRHTSVWPLNVSKNVWFLISECHLLFLIAGDFK